MLRVSYVVRVYDCVAEAVGRNKMTLDVQARWLLLGSICPAMLLPFSDLIPASDVVKGCLIGGVIGGQC